MIKRIINNRRPVPPLPGPPVYIEKSWSAYDPPDTWWKRLTNWMFVPKEFRPRG